MWCDERLSIVIHWWNFFNFPPTLVQGNATIVQRPSIWVIDLKTDSIVSRHEIPASVVVSGAGLASLTIDVIDCGYNTFAYLPDLQYSQIVVYDLAQNRSYKAEHNYFHMNPFQGDFNVDGLKFSWNDAIFSITLSEREKDSSYRSAFFHPMSRFKSIHKWNVSVISVKISVDFWSLISTSSNTEMNENFTSLKNDAIRSI